MMDNSVKSVKEELLDALSESLSRIEERNSVLQPVEADAARKEKDNVVARAGEDIASGVFAAGPVQRYNALTASIQEIQNRLKEKYGVDARYLDPEVIAGARKIAIEHLTARYTDRKAELDASLAAAQEAVREAQKADKQAVEREQQEFAYALKRKRQMEAEKHREDTDAQTKALQERFAASSEALADAKAKLEETGALSEKVAAMPAELSRSYEDGFAAGKKDAGQSYGIEKMLAEKERSSVVAKLEMQIRMLTDSVKSKTDQVAQLEKKLDAAYSAINDLSVSTVNAQGGVRVISTGDGGASKK